MNQDNGYHYKDNIDDDFYDSIGKGKKKKGRGVGRTLSKAALSIVMVAAICLLSITGYVWFTELPDSPALPASGTPSVSEPTQPSQTGPSVKTNYTLGETKEALTTPEIYIKVLPSVVSILCEVETTPAFGGFYGNQQPQTSTATGTGIVMTADGYIMTNHHVIDGAKTISVTTHDGVQYDATLIGSDQKSDIAVLKVNATNLTPAEFGDSTQLIAGEAAIVIGNPLGIDFAGTVTQGIISATERHLTDYADDGSTYMMKYIQIDAAVNPGNSGGPLINSRGQVVGIVNQKISRSDVEGIGFAIPTSVAMDIADDLIENGVVTIRPQLGITVYNPMSEEQANYYNELYKDDIAAGVQDKYVAGGMRVKDVVPGSTCDKAGVLPGDEIIAFNGKEATSTAELNLAKEQFKIGDAVTLTIKRNGETIVLDLILQGAVE